MPLVSHQPIISFHSESERVKNLFFYTNFYLSGFIDTTFISLVFQRCFLLSCLFFSPSVPPMVAQVTVTSRTVSSLTLSWDKQEDKNWTYILDINGASHPVTAGYSFDNFIINHLEPGTRYLFSVTTEFSGLRSSPYEGNTVTSVSTTI